MEKNKKLVIWFPLIIGDWLLRIHFCVGLAQPKPNIAKMDKTSWHLDNYAQ